MSTISSKILYSLMRTFKDGDTKTTAHPSNVVNIFLDSLNRLAISFQIYGERVAFHGNVYIVFP